MVTGFVSQSDYDTLANEVLDREELASVGVDVHEHCKPTLRGSGA